MASRTYITSNAKVSKIKIHSVHVGANIDKSIKKDTFLTQFNLKLIDY